MKTSKAVAQSALLFTLAACTGGRPARIVAGNSDTVVVNNRQPVSIPVRVFDAEGRVLRSSGLRYAWLAGDRVRLSEDGRVTCTQPGDAELRVSRGSLSTRFVLRCRPVQGFRFSEGIRLLAGGPPEGLSIGAVGVDGSAVTLLVGNANVRDDTIATLSDGRVYPKKPGVTFIDVSVGDCTKSIPVEVVERVESSDDLAPNRELVVSPLRLVGGQMRSWALPFGRYDLRLESDSSQPARLVLTPFGMNCARFPDGDQHYSCTAGERATVVVRNPRPLRQRRPISGDLSVRRLDDPSPPGAPTMQDTAASRDSARAAMCPEIMR